MIKVYILDCNVEEIATKNYREITNEEFKTFGKTYTMEEFEYGLNNSDIVNFNLSNNWVRCIEEKRFYLERVLGIVPEGFDVSVMVSSNIEMNKGILLVNPKVILNNK